MIVKKVKYTDQDKPKVWQIGELVDIFLEHMGLSEHQTVYGLHYNT